MRSTRTLCRFGSWGYCYGVSCRATGCVAAVQSVLGANDVGDCGEVVGFKFVEVRLGTA